MWANKVTNLILVYIRPPRKSIINPNPRLQPKSLIELGRRNVSHELIELDVKEILKVEI